MSFLDPGASERSLTPDLRRTDAYEYSLPPEQIARYPTDRRDRSRLLAVPRGILDRAGSEDLPGVSGFADLRFLDLPSLLRAEDVLVLNQSRVLPARLLGRKATGAACEVLLVRPVDEERESRDPRTWEALVRPGSKLKPGTDVVISSDIVVRVGESTETGGRIVRIDSDLPVVDVLERVGRVPLPPYLGRGEEPLDRERYQTVYARVPGSVAAPTAGLHFTPELLRAIEQRGVRLASVTLHVGPGTFRPVESDDINDHTMHQEFWRVPPETERVVQSARTRGGRVWAVGTTVVRTLESASGTDGVLRAGAGATSLYIRPGYRFRAVDALVTNFHLPRSTLMMLVSAFAGYRTTMEAYARAVDAGYRFYSYGDAMVVTPNSEGRAG